MKTTFSFRFYNFSYWIIINAMKSTHCVYFIIIFVQNHLWKTTLFFPFKKINNPIPSAFCYLLIFVFFSRQATNTIKWTHMVCDSIANEWWKRCIKAKVNNKQSNMKLLTPIAPSSPYNIIHLFRKAVHSYIWKWCVEILFFSSDASEKR